MNTNQGATIKETVRDFTHQGSETAHVIKDRAADMAEQVKQQTSAVVSRTLNFIDARPFAALGIAIAAGYLSRTLVRIGLIAGAGMLIAKLVPMVSGKPRV
jgi:ElaB/YqjD/DUF883 family membrane-anchored ribosome-binding protein